MSESKNLADRVRERLRGRPSSNGTGTTPPAPAGTSKEDKPERKSAATRLVELVEAAGVELFHTVENAAFARVPCDTHIEVWAVRSAGFKRWLTHRFYGAEGRTAGAQAVQDALAAVEGKASFDGPEIAVHVRLAEHGGRIYLDLANPEWEVVEIGVDGWRVLPEVPVRFRRRNGMLPLPAPVPGGTVEDLRPFVNVADDAAFCLLVAWLVQALRPRGPHPLLCLHGQQGSAKSTLVDVVRKLVDPNATTRRSEPKEPRDLMIAATNSWCVSLDNLSSLPAWLSDALCRLATGGGFSTRELYTDDEEKLFDAMRPVVVNGIEDLATRGDLLERAVLLNLPAIPEGKRLPERVFWAEFEAARPRILGALLTSVSGALRELPSVNLVGFPRMADFAEWATAAERSLGWRPGTFMLAYGDNRTEANEVALEASSLVPFVRRFVEANPIWTGTASALLEELKAVAGEAAVKSRDWPGSARVLSGRLKRLAPNLLGVGIAVEWGRADGKARTRIIRLAQLEKVRDGASAPSRASEAPQIHGENGDRADASGRTAGRADAPADAPRPPKSAAQDEPDAPDARNPPSSEPGPGEPGWTPF
jgi:hypothetical protein